MASVVLVNRISDGHDIAIEHCKNKVCNIKQIKSKHAHKHYEIFLYLSNFPMQYNINGNSCLVKKGDFVIIAPGVEHTPITKKQDKDKLFECMVLWISEKWLHRQFESDVNLRLPFEYLKKNDLCVLRSSQATWSGLYSAMSFIHTESKERKICYETHMAVSTVVFLIHLSRTVFYIQQKPSLEDEELMLLKNIIQYMHTHYNEQLSLDGIANRFLINKYFICKLFKKHKNTTFYQYLIQRRLIVAKNRILSGESISIAYQNCGFSDYSSFYRAFKKEYGISPKQFKEKST